MTLGRGEMRRFPKLKRLNGHDTADFEPGRDKIDLAALAAEGSIPAAARRSVQRMLTYWRIRGPNDAEITNAAVAVLGAAGQL